MSLLTMLVVVLLFLRGGQTSVGKIAVQETEPHREISKVKEVLRLGMYARVEMHAYSTGETNAFNIPLIARNTVRT